MATADRLIEIFNEAKARPTGAERERFLADVCGEDSTLKEQVLSLLQAHEGAGAFLENTPLISSTPLLTEKPGDRIGRYKLLQQIGEGGCGVVYMAEQEEPVRRRVALKVIKLGMDTKQVIARFEAERQALALMDHPNIAKVLDAGATETGRPFFVMELVRGIRITDYCDQNNLTTAERLELFIQVCHAVQHAHQKGIIHRDIKPSNILVTQHDNVAVPKVIDFGIAKATTGQLTDKTLFTAFAQFIGTPAYMSPEQAQMSGLDIDTRADIYSLGVLLYELLTGNTPFNAKDLLAAGLDEMRRRIREDEPARPSTCLSTMAAIDLTTVAKNRSAESPKLIHLVHGDLDWLVMKCLEKDRTRRYETANALAMDLQRHLNNEPVVACPPSNLYRFQKMVRRNTLAFAAASAVVAALVLGLGLSTWMFFKEKQARQRAVIAEQEQSRLRLQAEDGEKKATTEATKSRQVAQFMKDMLASVGPKVALGRDTKLLHEILDNTAERVGTDLKDQPEVEAELRSSIGATYLQLFDLGKAEAMEREALRFRRKLFGETNIAVVTSLNGLARILIIRRGAKDLVEAEALAHESCSLSEKLVGHESSDMALSLYLLASAQLNQGNPAKAELAYRDSLAIRRNLFGNEHKDVASSLNNLAQSVRMQGRFREAEELVRESMAIQRKLFGNEHPDVADSYFSLGRIYNEAGRLADAELAYRNSLAMRRKLMGVDHPQVATALQSLAAVLGREGKYAEAESAIRDALPILRRKQLGDNHPEVSNILNLLSELLASQGKLAEAETLCRELLVTKRKEFGEVHLEVDGALANLARLLHDQGKLAEAEAVWLEELAMERKLSGEEHPFVANSLSSLARVLQDQGKLAEAETTYREALAIRRKPPADDTPLARVLGGLTSTLLAAQKFIEAEPLARECLTLREKKLPDDLLTFNARSMLGGSLLGQKKYAEAEPMLLSGYEGIKQREDKIPADQQTNSKLHLKETVERLAQFYQATGQPEKAAEWKSKLAEFDSAEAVKKAP